MYSVHQHWDPLTTCVVGRSYPPEFYDHIKDTNVRTVMQRIAKETEEDLTYLCNTLTNFGISVLRPYIDPDYSKVLVGDRYLPAPITPRDDMAMVGDIFYTTKPSLYAKWNQLRGTDWPLLPPKNNSEYNNLPDFIKQELIDFGTHTLQSIYLKDFGTYQNIEKHVKLQGNQIVYDQHIDSAMVCRLGLDLFFGTWTQGVDHSDLLQHVESLFPTYHCHIIETGGHLDGTICPVCPGLVISTMDMDTTVLQSHFPGWEIFTVDRVVTDNEFNNLKAKNQGKWWLPGEEDNDEFTEYVQTYFEHWLGNIEETSIDVNMLILDPKNVLISQPNQRLQTKLSEYGIASHVVPLRHSYFWDGGLHCVTNDLNRLGNLQKFL